MATSTTGATHVANVANGRLRMGRPGSSFPVADPAPATLAGRDDKQRGRMEGTKGSSLVGETTTVAAAVITITTTANTTMATTTVNMEMVNTTMGNMETVNTTMDNITMDNTTTATTTMVSAVDSQMEVMHRINKMKTNQPMSFHHDFPPFLSSSVLCLLKFFSHHYHHQLLKVDASVTLVKL